MKFAINYVCHSLPQETFNIWSNMFCCWSQCKALDFFKERKKLTPEADIAIAAAVLSPEAKTKWAFRNRVIKIISESLAKDNLTLNKIIHQNVGCPNIDYFDYDDDEDDTVPNPPATSQSSDVRAAITN